MVRCVAAVLFAVVSGSCASSGQVHALETQVAELQKLEQQRDAQLHETLTHIEAELAQVMSATSHGGDAQTGELDRKIEELQARVALLKGPAAVPPPPKRPEPSPDEVYAIAVAGDPSKGPADALVTIVRAGEYACPYCERVRETLDQVAAAYPHDVRIVYKSFVVHPTKATDAAEAGCAAQRQGKYWQLDALLWEKAFKTSQYDKAHIEELAAEAGLDMKRFHADVASLCPGEMHAEQAALEKLGVAATPTMFINGRVLMGAQPVEQFKTLVDAELTKAKDRVKQGTRRKDYYETWVVKKGLTELVPAAPVAP